MSTSTFIETLARFMLEQCESFRNLRCHTTTKQAVVIAIESLCRIVLIQCSSYVQMTSNMLSTLFDLDHSNTYVAYDKE